MPDHDKTISFSMDVEQICIDTGASACISTKKENFVIITKLSDIKSMELAQAYQ
jgi:hypothetical protein